MARLTKTEKAELAEENLIFRRLEGLAQQKGYSLHRMMGLQPYGLLRNGKPAREGTLANLEVWLETN